MRRRLHERADGGQLPQHQLEAHVVRVLADWLGAELTADGCGKRQSRYQSEESSGDDGASGRQSGVDCRPENELYAELHQIRWS